MQDSVHKPSLHLGSCGWGGALTHCCGPALQESLFKRVSLAQGVGSGGSKFRICRFFCPEGVSWCTHIGVYACRLCVYICVYAQVHACAYGGWRFTLNVVPQESSILASGTVSLSWRPEAFQLAWTGWSGSSRDSSMHPCLPSWGCTPDCNHARTFQWVLETDLWPSHLYSQHYAA